MDALSSWLNDERRGVTYAWVARELCMPASEAINLLAAYALTAPKGAILAHHLVCGVSKAAPANTWNGGILTSTEGTVSPFIVAIVAEADLEGVFILFIFIL